MVSYIDEVESDLANLISIDFDDVPTSKIMLRDTLYAWLHYRARLIPQRPREVVLSNEVRALLKSHGAIGELAARLRIGDDVSPWLSNRVRLRKKDIKADLMFNDWQISHFHLGRFSKLSNRVERSDLLVFVYISATRCVFLDVQPHRSFSMQNLLRILLRTSPRDMNTEMVGVLPGTPMTDEEIFGLRAKGLNAPIILDGKTFISPGIGIASAGNAVRITQYGDMLMKMWRETLTKLNTNSLPNPQMMWPAP